MALIVVATTCLGFLSGCGLSEYQEAMEQQQKRMDYIDKENELLDDPLQLLQASSQKTPEPAPQQKKTEKGDTKKQSKATGLDFFLRPPKGIEKGAKPMPTSSFVWHYPKPGASGPGRQPPPGGMPPPPPGPNMAQSKDTGIRDVYVAAWSNIDKGEFWNQVLLPFGNPDRQKNAATVSRNNVDGKGMQFIRLVFTEQATPGVVFAYFYQENNDHVAVLFRVNKDRENSPDTQEAMFYSLQSLRIGGQAPTARKEYIPHSPPPGPGQPPPPGPRPGRG